MKKITAVILILVLLLPAVSFADSLVKCRTLFNLHASVWNINELPDEYAESKSGNVTYFIYKSNNTDIAFQGSSKDNVSIGLVFYDNGDDMGEFIYNCLAMADTMLSVSDSVNLAGMLVTNFAFCKKESTTEPYHVIYNRAILQRVGDQIVFSCGE